MRWSVEESKKKEMKKWQEHLLLPMLFMMVSKELCLNVLLDKKSQNPLMIIQLKNQKFQNFLKLKYACLTCGHFVIEGTPRI